MHHVEIKAITPLNHNVFSYKVSKPDDYAFTPGQATDLAMDIEGWRDEKRPFTFTSLPDDDHLEFTIKSYPDHDGVTEKMAKLVVGDGLLIDDPWGTIEYKGPGTFIAGGAGLTPFLAILRQLDADSDNQDVNQLFFANSTEKDVFCQQDLESMMRLQTQYVLSDEDKSGFSHGRIDQDFLKHNISNFDQKFYVCGPKPMVEDISNALRALGADTESINFEE